MVFRQDDSLRVALFIAKDEIKDATLRREEARTRAMSEIKAAGIHAKNQIEIEAFENEDGWMIFASTSLREPEGYVWMRFDSPDDFLDAYSLLAGLKLQHTGWTGAKDSFLLFLKGPVKALKTACTYLKEFAVPFDAPEKLALHLTEQAE